MNAELASKVVLITGASGGIGSAIARKFAAEGAKLVLHYRRNRVGVTALERELRQNECLVVRADLSREGEARRLFRQARERLGRVDTLVAHAGSWERRDVFLASDVLARHVTGPVLVLAGGMEGRWLWGPEEIDPAASF
jgi:NAD(P)-dependent dehydrogenase (short-subunit alcohol dehydrogenase family)